MHSYWNELIKVINCVDGVLNLSMAQAGEAHSEIYRPVNVWSWAGNSGQAGQSGLQLSYRFAISESVDLKSKIDTASVPDSRVSSLSLQLCNCVHGDGKKSINIRISVSLFPFKFIREMYTFRTKPTDKAEGCFFFAIY